MQVEVLSASTERMRDLGVLPGQSASLTFAPSGHYDDQRLDHDTAPTGIPLNMGISSADYS